jgi:hypothetical protein
MSKEMDHTNGYNFLSIYYKMSIGGFFRSIGRGIVKGAKAVNEGLKKTKIVSTLAPAVLPGPKGAALGAVARAAGYKAGGKVKRAKGAKKGGRVAKPKAMMKGGRVSK